MQIRHIVLAIATLSASSSYALLQDAGEASEVTITTYTPGWAGFATTYNGYDSTPKKIALDDIHCDANGNCDGPFVVVGRGSGTVASDFINGYSFGSGVQQVDRSSDNGIWVVAPEAVLDPADLAKKEECLKRCDSNRKDMEDNNAINYGKMKARYRVTTVTVSLAGAMIGVFAPGFAKLAAPIVLGGGAYLIAKEYSTDLLDAYDLMNKATVIAIYQKCKTADCKA